MTETGPPQLDLLTKQPVEGVLLAERLVQGTLSAEEVLGYAIEIGGQLQKAHAAGIVHGALSPESICLTASGAQVLAPGPEARLYNANYRAPEQVRGEAADTRADIYAFGAILYEMAAGTRAYPGEGPELDRSILEDQTPTLTLRSPVYDGMARVIDGCMQKSRTARRQRVQNAVIELRFAAKTANARLGGARPVARSAAPVEVDPLPEALKAQISETIKAHRAGPVSKPRPVEPPRSEEFFPKPGERVLRYRMHPPGWRALVRRGMGSYRGRLWLFIGACLALVGGAALGAALYFRPRVSAPMLRFAVAPDHTTFPGSPSVSPDGRLLVFSAQGPEGQRMLWLRPLDALGHTPIAGTEGATNPFWSPDSRSLAYFAGRSLKMVRIQDGLTETICKIEGPNGGGTWNPDGTILFSRDTEGLYRVQAKANSGATPVLKVNAGKGENGYLWPEFLPDGNHFVFFIETESTETTGVYTGAVGSAAYRLIFPSETNARYAARNQSEAAKSGFLLFIANRKLMGQGFNPGKQATVGEPTALAEDLGAVNSMSLAPISVSQTGTLVYQSAGKPMRQLVWTDRAGTPTAQVREPGEWGPPRISPEGRRAAVAKLGDDGKNADLWMVENDGSVKLFSHVPGASQGCPVWSPDGSKIAEWMTGKDQGEYDIYVQPAEGGGRQDPMFRGSFPKQPTDWSRDGRFILFNAIRAGTRNDVWAVSTGDRHAGPLLETVNAEEYAALSPDGKWMAYDSDESGRHEVYVTAFDGIRPESERKWKVSTTGGGLPRWRGDGKELFFLTPSGRLMSAAVHPEKSDFAFDAPVILFQTHPIRRVWNLYDVTRDGQRFLVNAPFELAASSDIMVVTNWTEKLRD